MREEHRLRIFKNERDNVRGDWKKLHNKHHDLYLLPNYPGGHIKKNEISRAHGSYRGDKRCIQGFGGETRGTDNSEDLGMDGSKEISWECVNWIDVAQDRDKWQAVVNVVMNLQFPYNVGNLLTKELSFSRRTLFHGVSFLLIN